MNEPMTSGHLLVSAWDWNPFVIAASAALAVFYLRLARPRTPLKTSLFLSGVTLLLIDLVSPLDLLACRYLFSAHVVQHMLLALIMAPLIVLGTPRQPVQAALRYRWVVAMERVLGNPAVAWPIGVLPMIGWHMPRLFNAALASPALHIIQHLSFLVTGIIFWWPILGPLDERRPGPLGAIVYLFSACTACSILGAALTFTPSGAYTVYAHAGDADPILRLIQNGWGLDPEGDQQLGGMLMWVPGCLIYLSAILTTLARWYASSSPQSAPGPIASAQRPSG
jgi:cytochrome c oxidase assembly factor CtaG